MERVGECNHCGACCRDPDKDTEKSTGLVQTVAGYCVYFRWTADGMSSCVGRDSAYYAMGCNVFPQSPRQLADKPLCSYRFIFNRV